jgi:enoyl-CoA hydratase/carnithine racemase
MTSTSLRVEREGAFAVVTLDRPERRNTLSLATMAELTDTLRGIGESDALGVILAATGPVFSAGHDFADMAGADLAAMRALFRACTTMMDTMQSIPQVVIAQVQGLATAAGCQLVASADLAVASRAAAFQLPGGRGGWFCHTPTVAVSRNVGRKRALELAFTGDPIDAGTALDWGLVNRVVEPEALESATRELLARATRSTREAKGMGKQGFYAHIDLDQPKAYAYAVELMAASSQVSSAQAGIDAFVSKRRARTD